MSATTPTTSRGYLSHAELEQFADITVLDTTEADDQISQAEEMLDSYVGPQNKAFLDVVEGKAVAGGTNTLTMETRHQNIYDRDYLIYCWCEIIGGTGVGQQRRITGQTYAGVITVVSNWTTAPDSTSIYKISQVAKFPRWSELFHNTNETPARYYKHIPEAVRRAVAAQVQYIIEMGATFFSTDKSEYTREAIGDYSYEKNGGKSSTSSMIAPKAKVLLRGIFTRVGELI